MVVELLSHRQHTTQRLNRPLAERLEPQPFVQRITTERVTADPRKRAVPQEFSGASIRGPSVYKEYQQARDNPRQRQLA